MTGKEAGPDLFDDAQYVVFKELLPYWAGFVKNIQMPEDTKKKPSEDLLSNYSNGFLVVVHKEIPGFSF